ncbi:MAG: GIY-YIG nuclease family protein [Firmicutes bacterium]|nr:GIY-YIG nuclease family protein [Bacillota bacterium]
MYFVYILTNYNKTVLYTGMTNDLTRRLYEHRYSNSQDGGIKFTQKYKCYQLVYYDSTNSVKSAIEREKQIKGWTRKKKEDLINSLNPSWKDLTYELNLR